MAGDEIDRAVPGNSLRSVKGPVWWKPSCDQRPRYWPDFTLVGPVSVYGLCIRHRLMLLRKNNFKNTVPLDAVTMIDFRQ